MTLCVLSCLGESRISECWKWRRKTQIKKRKGFLSLPARHSRHLQPPTSFLTTPHSSPTDEEEKKLNLDSICMKLLIHFLFLSHSVILRSLHAFNLYWNVLETNWKFLINLTSTNNAANQIGREVQWIKSQRVNWVKLTYFFKLAHEFLSSLESDNNRHWAYLICMFMEQTEFRMDFACT